uniref:DNA repair protein RAD51 homolog 3 n=1 Tax=Albugo laibachii Nc14 TaxID=890382 RepID=F0WT90_9STRA|nr:conserved hypothetical protein [Albugo laibachii Nc14]|eukprot:CCA24579.1 conserved hypothetical protein [Albugo laibachii Nc14]
MYQLERACRHLLITKSKESEPLMDERRLKLMKDAGLLKYRHLLHPSVCQIAQKLDLSIADTERFLDSVSLYLAPTPQNAFELFLANVNHPKQLRTNLPTLDTALGGGLHLGAITEIAGIAGVGKTQFAMTVALQILSDEILLAKDERTSTVIYFDAEATLNVERLKLDQIATAMLNTRKGFCRDYRAEDLLDRLLIIKVDTLAQFLTKLLKLGQNLRMMSGTKLLIVDSIAALYVHSIGESLTKKEFWLTRIARELKFLSDNFQICALLTNRAVSSFNEHGLRGSKPSLGDLWSHYVTYRLSLDWDREFRVLSITKSPSTKIARVQFVDISNEGVKEAREAWPKTSTTDEFEINDEAITDLDKDLRNQLPAYSSIVTSINEMARVQDNYFDELVAESSQEI